MNVGFGVFQFSPTRLGSVFSCQFVVLRMRHDVANIKTVMCELDEGQLSQMIATDIDYPPAILVAKVIQ